ncbi:MAG: radical SAM family heme chaperone HemW [Pseudomonadota bacterium]
MPETSHLIPPPVGLYVHIPWCEKKCPYCDFNSHVASTIPEDDYVTALLKDFEVEMSGESRAIETVFIGGGTPSLFSEESIRKLLTGIRQRGELRTDAEVTMEANPSSIEADRLRGYVDAGVTRFSLGIQSFNDKALSALGRVHSGKTARQAIRCAAASGATSFNLDLMHGLPGQSVENGLEDIATSLTDRPPHISWYQLTIEPNTRFYKYPPTLPVEHVLGDLEDQGVAMLDQAGYRRYEVSAWALPGEECQHNLNYWTFGDYVAIGAGAHGKLTGSDAQVIRYSKTRRPEDYLKETGKSRRSLRALDEVDRCGEFAMNALRLSAGFSLELFEARTGLEAVRIQHLLEELQQEGLLEKSSKVKATALGWRFLDDLVGRFFDLRLH